MLTEKNIADVVDLLKMVEGASVKQWQDPEFVGRMGARAFIAGMPLRMELAVMNVSDAQREE